MAERTAGKRVAILAADMVERVELVEPRKALEDAGATVELVSIREGEIKAFDHFDPAGTIPVDRTVEEAQADDYDALMVPGGVGSPDQLRGDENAVAFIRDFFEQRKPVAAICHAPWVLIEAGVVQGRAVTSWPTLGPTCATRARSGSTGKWSSTTASSSAGSRTTSRRSTRR